ncbi:MAG TPA: MobF family relaxase [Gaiellaceae bacterium]|nr:MobF family relaxase [Gaiellaceae bacterium]
MLSVAKLTLGQEAYYEQQVARGLDDYYAGRGESPGLWAGSGSAGLGLVGVVEDGDLGTLLRGVSPADDSRLRAPVRERTITVRTLDVESGEWREQQKRLAPVSGYDLVFSCPKSVSLLHALTDDEQVRREVSEAHESSWQAALAYLEREACVVRRGKGGTMRERGEGFVAAAFRHRTSRAQDPHLHTHVIVANMARGEDGEWRALDGEAILKTYRLAAGYLYEARLRHELSHRLGLEWTQPVKGMGELVRVPEEAIRVFSTRRRSLLEHMEALGTEGFVAARVAALATREAKEQVDPPRLREEWQARAAEHGLGRREVEALVVERPRPGGRIAVEPLAACLLGPEGLTATQTTFTMPELVRAVAGSLPQGATVDEVLVTAAQLSRLPGIEPLEHEHAAGRPARFTTRELLEIERAAVDLAVTGQGRDAPQPDRRTLLRSLLHERELSNEQRQLVLDASSSPDRVVCVVGVAGAGKTTALRTLAAAHHASELTVLGAAPSGRAADELQTATGIPSSTMHRLLLDAHREGGLPRRCVLVVDEAGMAETRVLAPLLELVDQADGKAILIGDPAQLPAVGAGGIYPALCDRLGALELLDNRRQHDPHERDALAHLRRGEPEPYLAHAAHHGRLTVGDNPTATKQRLLEDWWQTAQHDLHATVMLAHRRADVHDLNQAAHTLMLRAGRLGPDAVELGRHEFRVGDRVLCRHNDSRLGIRNGTRASIIALDQEKLTLRADNGATRQLPPAYAAEHLEHGYALTGHAAQGATVDRAYVLLPDQGAVQEWGYVACTRARSETRLYLTEHDTLERETPLRDPDPAASPERALHALQRAAAEPLALDQTATRPDLHARLHARRQEQLAQQRDRAAVQLATAQRELNMLGWWSRGQRRSELECEIALRQTALRGFDKKRQELAQMTPPRPRRMPELGRDHDETYRSLRPEPPNRPVLRHDPPSLGLEL